MRGFTGDGIVVLIDEGVIEGINGVKLGAVVTVAIGAGVMFPQAPTRNKMRVTENTINTRFSGVINNSISNSKDYDNWPKDKFLLQAQSCRKEL